MALEQEQIPLPGKGMVLEPHDSRIGSFLDMVIKTQTKNKIIPPPDTGRNDNYFYFLYHNTPLESKLPWVGELMLIGPFYLDMPEWKRIAYLHTDLRIPEELNIRGPNQILVVTRCKETCGTTLVWIPRN